jgi:hypothetical protein
MNWFHVFVRYRPATLPEPEAVSEERPVLPGRFRPAGGADLPKSIRLWIVQGELQRRGWPEAKLRGRPKEQSGKLMLARRLGQETTMSLKWIAERLQMGTWTYVSNLLNEIINKPALPTGVFTPGE